jgi:hypothetical protein
VVKENTISLVVQDLVVQCSHSILTGVVLINAPTVVEDVISLDITREIVGIDPRTIAEADSHASVGGDIVVVDVVRARSPGINTFLSVIHDHVINDGVTKGYALF